jgi:hypothetical protein
MTIGAFNSNVAVSIGLPPRRASLPRSPWCPTPLGYVYSLGDLHRRAATTANAASVIGGPECSQIRYRNAVGVALNIAALIFIYHLDF